jgi:tRNA (pseudouridine54-N1)-methyltransferase
MIGNKRAFLVIGNKAVTGKFNLNDLPGSAGRMDIMCRCIASALFLSHDVRRDVEVYLLLLGPPDPPKAVRVVGGEVKYMAPDERNIGGILSKALTVKVDKSWRESTPGVYVARKTLEELLDDLVKKYEVYYLREDGMDIREVELGENSLFILGDHIGVREDMEAIIEEKCKGIVSIPTRKLQADHCIVIAHYELDRREREGV